MGGLAKRDPCSARLHACSEKWSSRHKCSALKTEDITSPTKKENVKTYLQSNSINTGGSGKSLGRPNLDKLLVSDGLMNIELKGSEPGLLFTSVSFDGHEGTAMVYICATA